MAIEGNWAKDLIVDEPDEIPRFNVVLRSGAIQTQDVHLRLSSPIVQNPTMFSASQLNAFLDRDNVTLKLYPKLITRE